MPRHRIEREPRHRAQRSDGGRRARLRAATTRPPGHAKPPTAPGRVRITWAAIAVPDRLVALVARLRPPRRVLTGAMRGLVVSPWFAAGAGFVVAAGAFIYAPHASLQFETQCKLVVCQRLTPLAAPPVIAGTGQGQLRSAAPSTAAPAAPARMTFGYIVEWHAGGAFQMLLTVTSTRAIGNWRLAFAILGATNVAVHDAHWQPSGTDGGTASGTAGDGEPSYSGTQGSGYQDGWPGSGTFGNAPSGYHGYAYSLHLVVTGEGAPAAPAGCSYDGSPCSFSRP